MKAEVKEAYDNLMNVIEKDGEAVHLSILLHEDGLLQVGYLGEAEQLIKMICSAIDDDPALIKILEMTVQLVKFKLAQENG